MPTSYRLRCVFNIILATAAISFVTLPVDRCLGQVPFDRYLEGLTGEDGKGYYDTALEYLEFAKSDPTIPPSVKKRIPYHKAKVLLDGISSVKDREKQTANIEIAQKLLKDFTTANANHTYTPLANKTLGNLLFRRGKLSMLRSTAEGVEKPEAQQLVLAARTFFQESKKVLDSSRESLRAQIKKIDPKIQDPTLKELLTTYQHEYMRVRLLQGLCTEDLARTFPAKSKDQQKNLEAAAVQYVEYSKAYRHQVIAFRAKYYAARCQLDLGKKKEAQDNLLDVLELDDLPILAPLKRDCALLGAEVWRDNQREMVVRTVPVLKIKPREQTRDASWLELHYKVAIAAHSLMQKPGLNARELADAKKVRNENIRFVAISSGEFREDAVDKMVAWKVGRAVDDDPIQWKDATFEVAKEKGSDALSEFDNLKNVLSDLQSKLKAEPDQAKKAKLEADIKLTIDSQKVALQESLNWLGRCLVVADSSTPRDDLNLVLYKVAFAQYFAGDYDRSLVVVEHLLTSAPTAEASKAAVPLAVNSLGQLAAADPGSSFEKDHLKLVCDQVLRNWPGDPVGVRATSAVIKSALAEKPKADMKTAEAYLAKVQDGTEGKSDLQLKVGFLIWVNGKTRAIEAAALAKKDRTAYEAAMAESVAELEKSATYLDPGLAGLTPEKVDSLAARAALALAQLYGDDGKHEKTLAILENPVYGPVSLIRKNHRVVSPKPPYSSYSLDALLAALRAHVGALRTAKDPDAVTAKAQKIMGDMKKLVAGDEKQAAKVNRLYVRMANDAKKTLATMDAPKQREAYEKGLFTFLDAVTAGAEDLEVLNWVASTYLGFGEGIEEKSPEKAQEHFKKAAVALKRILDVHEAEVAPIFLKAVDERTPEEKKLAGQISQINRNYAKAMGRSGEYQVAIDLYIEILKKKSSLLDVQMDAAMLLYKKGVSEKHVNSLAMAMMGTGKYKDKSGREKNAVWGFGNMANMLVRTPQFRDRFVEARYHLAQSRYEYAKLRKKEDYFKMAERDIFVTENADPKLGGPEWTAKFEKLMVKIRKELNKAEKWVPRNKQEPDPKATVETSG